MPVGNPMGIFIFVHGTITAEKWMPSKGVAFHMNRRVPVFVAFAILLSVGLIPTLSNAVRHKPVVAEAFSARNLARGSTGYDVDELQNRLKFLGYYHGKIDGIFGWSTYWAVRNFQYKFGIQVNGIVDMKTKTKLVAATNGWHYHRTAMRSSGSGAGNHNASSSQASNAGNSSTSGGSKMPTVPGVSQSDLLLMAHVVYGEARGEPQPGEVAIAAVILNRLRDPRFPHSVSAIVYQPGAFTAVADGQVNLQPDDKARKAVEQAVHGIDPSRGAVYYFNPATATNKWIWARPEILKIGKHIFCR
jgi:N-acetylmuramoyl-L-alanine amidase